MENKANERRVWARQTASLVLLVWPKGSFGFSMHRHRKPQMNFLAKPNNLPSKLGGSHSEEVASEGAWRGQEGTYGLVDPHWAVQETSGPEKRLHVDLRM